MEGIRNRTIPRMAAGGHTGGALGLNIGTNTPTGPAIQAAVWPPLEKLVQDAVRSQLFGGIWTPLVGLAIAALAQSFVGRVPYVWGGTSTTGWDCSGMVLNILSRFGIDPPRTSQAQQRWATPTGTPFIGGLSFYVGADGTRSAAGHVGINVGSGILANAFGTGFGTIDSPVGMSGYLGSGIPPGAALSFSNGGWLTEPVAGIGLKSGRGYRFHSPEAVTSQHGLADLAGRLVMIADAIMQNAEDTGLAVAEALGGFAGRASATAHHSAR